jgi:hypothetical protein
MRRAAVLVGLAACATQHHVATTGRELHTALATLREEGRANVAAVDTVGDDSRPMVTSLAFDGAIAIDDKWITVRDATARCPAAPPVRDDEGSEKACPLVRLRDEEIRLPAYTTRDVRGAVVAVVGTAVLGVIAGAATCEIACSDGSLKDASTYTLLGAGALVVGSLVWMVISCSGHWGEPGCHD